MSDPSGIAIEAHGLWLSLPMAGGEEPVLAGVDLSAAAGEVVALIGPSGCGKTTLLEVLAGLRAADAGSVALDGDADAPRLGRLTLMPQRDSLLPWATLRENVAIGAELAGASGRAAHAAADRALARFGLTEFAHHYPHALSGGMRQRAALARTLLGGSGAWLLDEPFGALDALTRADLHAELARLWAARRPTVILVTHDLDEALVLADRVLVSSPRPARVQAEIVVDLPRPRGLATTTTPAFGARKAELLHALEGAGALA